MGSVVPTVPDHRALDQAAVRFADRVVVEKINADQQPIRVRQLNVRAVPTLIALRGEREIARLTGAQSEKVINDLFGMAAGDGPPGPQPASGTDRIVRLAAAGAVFTVGLQSGPAIPLLVVGVAIGATALPRPTRMWASR